MFDNYAFSAEPTDSSSLPPLSTSKSSIPLRRALNPTRNMLKPPKTSTIERFMKKPKRRKDGFIEKSDIDSMSLIITPNTSKISPRAISHIPQGIQSCSIEDKVSRPPISAPAVSHERMGKTSTFSRSRSSGAFGIRPFGRGVEDEERQQHKLLESQLLAEEDAVRRQALHDAIRAKTAQVLVTGFGQRTQYIPGSVPQFDYSSSKNRTFPSSVIQQAQIETTPQNSDRPYSTTSAIVNPPSAYIPQVMNRNMSKSSQKLYQKSPIARPPTVSRGGSRQSRSTGVGFVPSSSMDSLRSNLTSAELSRPLFHGTKQIPQPQIITAHASVPSISDALPPTQAQSITHTSASGSSTIHSSHGRQRRHSQPSRLPSSHPSGTQLDIANPSGDVDTGATLSAILQALRDGERASVGRLGLKHDGTGMAVQGMASTTMSWTDLTDESVRRAVALAAAERLGLDLNLVDLLVQSDEVIFVTGLLEEMRKREEKKVVSSSQSHGRLMRHSESMIGKGLRGDGEEDRNIDEELAERTRILTSAFEKKLRSHLHTLHRHVERLQRDHSTQMRKEREQKEKKMQVLSNQYVSVLRENKELFRESGDLERELDVMKKRTKRLEEEIVAKNDAIETLQDEVQQTREEMYLQMEEQQHGLMYNGSGMGTGIHGGHDGDGRRMMESEHSVDHPPTVGRDSYGMGESQISSGSSGSGVGRIHHPIGTPTPALVDAVFMAQGGGTPGGRTSGHIRGSVQVKVPTGISPHLSETKRPHTAQGFIHKSSKNRIGVPTGRNGRRSASPYPGGRGALVCPSPNLMIVHSLREQIDHLEKSNKEMRKEKNRISEKVGLLRELCGKEMREIGVGNETQTNGPSSSSSSSSSSDGMSLSQQLSGTSPTYIDSTQYLIEQLSLVVSCEEVELSCPVCARMFEGIAHSSEKEEEGKGAKGKASTVQSSNVESSTPMIEHHPSKSVHWDKEEVEDETSSSSGLDGDHGAPKIPKSDPSKVREKMKILYSPLTRTSVHSLLTEPQISKKPSIVDRMHRMAEDKLKRLLKGIPHTEKGLFHIDSIPHPISLFPCGHTVCQCCVIEAIAESGDEEGRGMKCPICGEKVFSKCLNVTLSALVVRSALKKEMLSALHSNLGVLASLVSRLTMFMDQLKEIEF
ncbi:hypothetical protein ADUPG1_007328 [Aduncisulcus paluster]|uniref:RING-type domain-containing protein n=1 Tax=Aduncisulcus paluster TaxID=2918883 RepID=A0ABQ5KLN0_9EUKA|nr:hypothetical protein ADUPG1_007328 [Aduncisulcus paluster]